MQWQRSEPQCWPQAAGVIVLEAEPGAARDDVVTRWLDERRNTGGPTWHVHCRQQEGGPWAGLDTLVEELVAAIRERAPELLARHSHELCLVVPRLESELTFPRSLTDTSEEDEKTRNYAADRAYRALHGLIDLMSEWHALSGGGPWSVACDGYDDANGLVRRFFTELIRRRGARLGLQLLAVCGPRRGEDLAAELDPGTIVGAVRLALPAEEREAPTPAAMTVLASELERQMAADPDPGAAATARLIDAWRRSDAPQRALPWQLDAMERFNHAGLYEASLPYAEDLRAQLDRLAEEDVVQYHRAVNVLYFCWVPLDKSGEARAVLEQVLARADEAADVARYCYLLSMLHARFLEAADQALAEKYLQRGLEVLPGARIPDDERHFLTVFTMNGLAFVRLRQGRVEEALELCRQGVARLDRHLHPERHRLHRSVLLFNIAQVHAHIGPFEVAVDYLSQAMEMDPNYSEYYNDRGAVYFKMHRLAEAERDYLHAIELSPPYAEVWTNLGQCWREMDRMQDAANAYTRALDLDPGCTLAVLGRADAQLALDRPELARADYDRALEMEPDQPLVLASRAIAHYEEGRPLDALADLDAAVGLAPDVAELYQNRAVALLDLGREDEAARDLAAYLRLAPDADDRAEVENSLALLGAPR
ncbi:MAG: hypothetical protein QOI48_4354 [Solirubrobacteraceae bacterium]|jgi:tetratricopeptide (TPR) repeat protein|nr:hypothetical protein [Solirubrobacteraceae bacterium]